jgi:hypothetical protein
MSLSRRSFLNNSAAFGLLPALLASSEFADATATQAGQASRQATAGEEYYKSLYSSTRAKVKIPNEDREPRFVHYSNATGLRWVEDIKTTELPSFDEDAVITMELTGLRGGSKDHSALTKVQLSQLHVSCQRVTGSEFLGPIVWAALATAFTSKATKFPSAQSLSWSAMTTGQTLPQSPVKPAESALNHVVLNHGAGYMTIAITTTPPESTLGKFLGGLLTATKILSPLLGFPGIALPALESFYTFYGELEQAKKENFLLNSGQKDIVVTQQGAVKAGGTLVSANALKLLSGDYIVMPQSQENDFAQDMSKLVVQNGYVVETDSVEKNSNTPPDKRVADAIPTVSYLTLSVKVQPASSFPATAPVTDPLLDSSPQASNSADTKSKGKSH